MSELKNLALGSVDEKSALFESIADKIWDNPELPRTREFLSRYLE